MSWNSWLRIDRTLSKRVRANQTPVRRAQRRPLLLEPLENRRLLTTITGPDAFGYQASTYAFEAIDLVAGEPGVTAPFDGFGSEHIVDDDAQLIALGDNTFNFYGFTYTGSTYWESSSLYVSTNGLLTGGVPNAAFINTDLTYIPPGAFGQIPNNSATIAPLWDDWLVSSTTGVLTKIEPGRLIIEWSDVRSLTQGGFGTGLSDVTFQAILELNTGSRPGDIIFNYVDLNAGSPATDGASATVGIKDDGAQGPNRLLVSFNSLSPYVGDGMAILNSFAVITTTTVTAADATYDGSQHGATAVADVAGEFEFLYTGTGATAYSSSVAPSAAGAYHVVASFTPADPSVYYSSTDSADYSILANTTTTLTSSISTSAFGQVVTLTAAVGGVVPRAGTPTGTVTFLDGGASLGTGTLDAAGQATLSTAELSVGAHTLTAIYGGDVPFLASAGVLAGSITTVAGNGAFGYSGDGGAATAATLANPDGVAVDAAGNLFIADTNNHLIRKVSPAGIITIIAGNFSAGSGYSGDGGPATAAQLSYPFGVTVDAAGNLFIADTDNSVIRKVDAAGIITTVAGNGVEGYSGNLGAAGDAQLYFPTGIAVDAAGNLFIADSFNFVVRKVDAAGIITTVAGDESFGAIGYSGDGGAAIDARLSGPAEVAVDAAGNLFIADLGNNVIRKVDAAGIITTVAGNFGAGPGYSGDHGPATLATLNSPTDVAVDAAGNLFIADYVNNVIRMVSPAGIITTVAGNFSAGAGYSGDHGPASLATLYNPNSVVVDAAGDLFIADSANNVIRKVTPSLLVNQAGTTTTLTSSSSATIFGQVVTYTATVAVVAPGAGTPTGTLTFVYNGSTLGAGTLDAAGRATLAAAGLPPGTHIITASYSGDANFGGSAGARTQQVGALNAASLQQALAVNSAIIIQAASSAEANKVLSAVNGLPSYAASPVTVTLSLTGPTYTGMTASPPAGVTLVITGDGSTTTVVGSPALKVTSGTVIVTSVIFSASGNAPTIKVMGGQVTIRNSTIEESSGGNEAAILINGGLVDLGVYYDDPGLNTIIVHGLGDLIRNKGANGVPAYGNTFLKDGAYFANDFRIEDAIDHAMDGNNHGLVTWSPGVVFVSATNGRIQRGVDLVPEGGYVYVETAVRGNFSAGTKLLTVLFEEGSSVSQQADSLDPTQRALVVMGTYGDDTIKFEPGSQNGVSVKMNDFPKGTFRPNGRLIAYGVEGSDEIEVSGEVYLPAWLFGGYSGNNRLTGGGGNDLLQGGYGDDTLIARGGRDLLIGSGGADRLEGKSGDDLLIGGYWAFGDAGWAHETAVAAIMAEWTSGLDYDTRVDHLMNGGGLNDYYTLTPSATVYDDGFVNTLMGGAGRDLFFASLLDEVVGLHANETVLLV